MAKWRQTVGRLLDKVVNFSYEHLDTTGEFTVYNFRMRGNPNNRWELIFITDEQGHLVLSGEFKKDTGVDIFSDEKISSLASDVYYTLLNADRR